jgi:hypothetical protein
MATDGIFPFDSVPPMMKNFLISEEAETRFLILFYEMGTGLAEYFSGLKYTRMAFGLLSRYMAFSFY